MYYLKNTRSHRKGNEVVEPDLLNILGKKKKSLSHSSPNL